jgi:hypothetical protein
MKNSATKSKLSHIELEELISRYNQIIAQYVNLAKELSEKLDKFGKIRAELQVLTTEFVERGFVHKDPELLKEMLEAELERVKTEKKEDGKQSSTD